LKKPKKIIVANYQNGDVFFVEYFGNVFVFKKLKKYKTLKTFKTFYVYKLYISKFMTKVRCLGKLCKQIGSDVTGVDRIFSPRDAMHSASLLS